VGQIAALTSRQKRLAVSVSDFSPAAYPMLLPHRISATVVMNYLEKKNADAAETRIRELFGKGGPEWELELISDRSPMPPRKTNNRLIKSLGAVAEEWSIPLNTDSSLWPSAAGLVTGKAAVACGLGPVARDIYTPHEAVQRISVIQRALLLAQFLLDRNN
jgi:D-alanine-D-alanine ligase